MARDVIGISVPFRNENGVFPVLAGLEESVRNSVRTILTTRRGERVNRPTYGCRVWDYVFESNAEVARIKIRDEIRKALTLHEPRITVERIGVEALRGVDGDGYTVTIEYRVNGRVMNEKLELVP